MRITPIDIQNKQFRAARMRGYNADDVDSFLDEIAAEIDSAGKEIAALQSQLQQSKTELSSFEELKGTLNSAILSAQKLADDIRAAAEVDSARMIAEANQKVEEIQSDALSKHQAILSSIDRLSAAEQTFRDRFIGMLSDFEGMVNSREPLTPTDVIAAESAVSADFAPAAPVAEVAIQETLEAEPEAAPAPLVAEAIVDEPVAEQVIEPAAESVIEPVIEPVAEAEPEPIIEPLQPQAAEVDEVPPYIVEPEAVAAAEPEAALPEAAATAEEAAPSVEGSYDVPAEPYAAETAGAEGAAPETFTVPEVAPAEEASVVYEIAPEPVIEAPAAPEPVVEEPAATFDLGGAQVADDLSSKDEIAEAVERMRRMLGEAGVDPNPAPPAAAPNAAASDDDPNMFEQNSSSDTFGAGAGFGDLGEGVPGVVRRRREGSEGSGSEVD